MSVTLSNCKQAPFNTTLMGVVRGVLDFYEIEMSTAMAYGLTGHAFLINIHETLCPSGPYCWKRIEFEDKLRAAGLDMRDLGFFDPSSTPKQRQEVEARLKAAIDEGTPCSLMNMENQLIAGYDGTGFNTAQPWAPHVKFPPAHLEFGTWQEFGDEIHVNFYVITGSEPQERIRAVRDALSYAADVFATPSEHTSGPYGCGRAAYRNWTTSVEGGAGDKHGNWWNGVVWAECRAQAGDFLRELAEAYPSVADGAAKLAGEYDAVADLLRQISDKSLERTKKLELLAEAAEKDAACAKSAGLLAALIH
jgi:hypothetical protein